MYMESPVQHPTCLQATHTCTWSHQSNTPHACRQHTHVHGVTSPTPHMPAGNTHMYMESPVQHPTCLQATHTCTWSHQSNTPHACRQHTHVHGVTSPTPHMPAGNTHMESPVQHPTCLQATHTCTWSHQSNTPYPLGTVTG